MTRNSYSVLLWLLALSVVAAVFVAQPDDQATRAAIDCQYQNPELKGYVDRIQSCQP